MRGGGAWRKSRPPVRPPSARATRSGARSPASRRRSPRGEAPAIAPLARPTPRRRMQLRQPGTATGATALLCDGLGKPYAPLQSPACVRPILWPHVSSIRRRISPEKALPAQPVAPYGKRPCACLRDQLRTPNQHLQEGICIFFSELRVSNRLVFSAAGGTGGRRSRRGTSRSRRCAPRRPASVALRAATRARRRRRRRTIHGKCLPCFHPCSSRP